MTKDTEAKIEIKCTCGQPLERFVEPESGEFKKESIECSCGIVYATHSPSCTETQSMDFEQYMNRHFYEAVKEYQRYLDRGNVPEIGSLVTTTEIWGVEDEIGMHCEVVGILDETDGYEESHLHLLAVGHDVPNYVVPISKWYRYIAKL